MYSGDLISTKARILSEYNTKKDSYRRLKDEIESLLQVALSDADVAISSISSRVKTYRSLKAKLERKSYNQLSEIPDIAGVRVVCLYEKDKEYIKGRLTGTFGDDGIKVEDHRQDDKFGYTGLHIGLCFTDEKFGGFAKSRKLDGLWCEVQVRTVLEDAWAIHSHHVQYKHEALLTPEIRRQFSKMKAILEVNDEEFERIQKEATLYIEQTPINPETLKEFLDNEAEMPGGSYDGDDHLQLIVERLVSCDLRTLSDIRTLMSKTATAREIIRDVAPPAYVISEVARAIAIAYPESRNKAKWSPKMRMLFESSEPDKAIEK